MQSYYSKSTNIMINFDSIVNKEKVEHNTNYPYIPDDPFRVLIIDGSGPGKTNSLFNLLHYKDYEKIYLFIKDPGKAKYNYLIEKRQQVRLRYGGINRFIEVYSDLNDLNPNINIDANSLIVFDDVMCEADLHKNA